MKRAITFAFMFVSGACYADVQVLRLYPGYVTRIQCQGRLLMSAVGNDALLRLEALPKELGCGAILKPVASVGRTNLILESSTGTIQRVLEIAPTKVPPGESDLHFEVRGDSL
jgi:hypothetical protein